MITREREREMLPLCADQGIQTIVYSPLARGRLTRPWGETTARSEAESAAAALLYDATAAADREIVGALSAIAAERGVSQQIALAWLRRNPVVVAPIIGAPKTSNIDDAIAALAITLTDDESARLEAGFTPRRDIQGISDPATLARMAAQVGVKTAS